jgi:hypothetical protein
MVYFKVLFHPSGAAEKNQENESKDSRSSG